MVFRPPREPTSRLFLGSALLSFGALLALGSVFAASSISHYIGAIDAGSLKVRAVSAVLVLAAAVTATMRAGRTRETESPRGRR